MEQKQKIECLKQMAPAVGGKKVFMLAPYENGKGLSQKKAIEQANQLGARILNNKEVDRRIPPTIFETGVCDHEEEVYPVWTGTYVAFKKADEKLGDAIKYTSDDITYIFEVPKEYHDEKNAILAVNHGFLSDGKPILTFKEDGKNILVDIADKSKIVLLRNFPSYDGSYECGYYADNEFGIPCGSKYYAPKWSEQKRADPEARILYRWKDDYCGLLARGNGMQGPNRVGFGRREVRASTWRNERFGVLITAPEGIMK